MDHPGHLIFEIDHIEGCCSSENRQVHCEDELDCQGEGQVLVL